MSSAAVARLADRIVRNNLYAIDHCLAGRGAEIEIELAVGNCHIHGLDQRGMRRARLREHIVISDWRALDIHTEYALAWPNVEVFGEVQPHAVAAVRHERNA